MNTDNNQRFKDTEKKILSAYGRIASEKPIDKITVSDICKEAQLHRTTFYGHYQDVVELQKQIEKIQFGLLLDAFVTEDGWDLKEGIMAQLNFYYENQRIVKRNLLEPSAMEHAERIFSFDLTENFRESYRKRFNLKSDMEVEYHQSFISAGASSVIKKWVLSGCKEKPEEIAELLVKILSAI